MSISRYPIRPGGASGLSDLDDVDVTAAQVGQVVAVAQVGPLTFELVGGPPVAAATVYVAPGGTDAADGLSWAAPKATISAAVAALGGAGGVVELGAGTHTVSSSGRFDSCTYTSGSSTVTDAAITAGDVGAYVISPYLVGPAVIATVAPGVSFTVTDESGGPVTATATGTVTTIITEPAIVVPPGVRLRGRGGSWTGTTSAQSAELTDHTTLIQDSGTGITILCGHPVDGVTNTGQRSSGTYLEDFAVKGNVGNIAGLAQINNWYVIVEGVDLIRHGRYGLVFGGNANATRFADCHFSGNGNGAAAATYFTGGVVEMDNNPLIPFGPVKFDNCFFTNNRGWGIVGTADLSTPKGARSIRVSQGQFNAALTTAVTGSGTHVAISGNENRSLLDDCIFEGADVLDLDVYDAPVTAIACKFKATGGTLGTLTHTVRVNSGATFEAIGCGFRDATAYHVQVAAGGLFNWRSCESPNGAAILAADSVGNTLAVQADAGRASGTTAAGVVSTGGEFIARLITLGILPASWNGPVTLDNGGLSTTGTLAARFLRATGTGAGDVVCRFDGVSGATGDLFQARVNGVNRFTVGANGDTETTTSGAGIIVRSPNGTRYRLGVDNGGVVVATAL